MRTRSLLPAFACLFALSASAGAQAQADDYPNRPIRLLVGFPPGGIST